MKTCLLLTDRFEPTADLLVAEMRRRAVPCVRWNLDQFPVGSTLTYRASGDGFHAEIFTDGRKVDLDRVASIWCRGVQALGFPPELGAPDFRGNVPGKPMSPDDVSDVVAWLAAQRPEVAGQPYPARRAAMGERP